MPRDFRYSLSMAYPAAFMENRMEAVGDQTVLDYQLSGQADLDLETEHLVLRLQIDAYIGQEGDALLIASQILFCIYDLHPSDPDVEPETWTVSRTLMASLLGIAISTARGVLLGRAQNPIFTTQPLPVLSPLAEMGHILDLSTMPWLAPEDGGAAPALPPARPTRARKKAE